jgi:glutamyl-tRNA reductase
VLVIVGVSHRTAPLEIREALAFQKDSLKDTLLEVREQARLGEVMILSTCNRVEVYGRLEESESGERVSEFLARFHGKATPELESYLYRLSGDEAVRHAFRVAASLDSMVIGEPQILGQVKEAYHLAESAGTLGSVLSALRNRSLASAKRARSETGIGHNAVSVSYVAVELARKIFGDLKDRSVLLVGAGKMSELAAKHLVRNGARATVLGGRRFERAEQLAASLGGTARPFDSLRDELGRADIVISGTGAPGVVIHREDVVAAYGTRRRRPLFLIDIAVPRDIDPSVRELEGIFLYDLDDLRSVAEANLRERRKQAAAAEALVEREAREFIDWQRSLDVVPLLIELRRRAEDIRTSEIEKVRARLGGLSPEQEEAVQAATSAIVNKLLHPSMVQLKEASRNGHPSEHISVLRRLLGLDSRG